MLGRLSLRVVGRKTRDVTKRSRRFSEIVGVDNFARIATQLQMRTQVYLAEGVNKWHHVKEPTPVDQQEVIRSNRDTLYSFAVVNLRDGGAKLTLPAADRYQSVMVQNEKGYVNKVYHADATQERTFALTYEMFETDFVMLFARTMLESDCPEDIEAANDLQCGMKIDANSDHSFVAPDINKESYNMTLEALLALSRTMNIRFDYGKRMFGKKSEVSEVKFLLGAASGWGGLPVQEAVYQAGSPSQNNGETEHKLEVRDVPINDGGFWSISVYDEKGYFPEDSGKYTINSKSAKHDDGEEGKYTIYFGNDNPNEHPNFVNITNNWNYLVRMYQPKDVILNDEWRFPDAEPIVSI